jgi:hypothetical protein
VLPLMERLGFFRMGVPDYAYMAVALALMGLFITYIILAYSVWRPKQMRLEEMENNT